MSALIWYLPYFEGVLLPYSNDSYYGRIYGQISESFSNTKAHIYFGLIPMKIVGFSLIIPP